MLPTMCPKCGGVLNKEISKGVFSDIRELDMEGNALQGCMCYFTSSVLSRLIESYEIAFLDLLKEHFPGRKKEQILDEVRKLEKNTPLRVRVKKGFDVLRQAKERLLEITRREQLLEKKKEDKIGVLKENSMAGKAMSIKDWMLLNTTPKNY